MFLGNWNGIGVAISVFHTIIIAITSSHFSARNDQDIILWCGCDDVDVVYGAPAPSSITIICGQDDPHPVPWPHKLEAV